jgi:hypothetical protein
MLSLFEKTSKNMHPPALIFCAPERLFLAKPLE